jgi:hypothetical protein
MEFGADVPLLAKIPFDPTGNFFIINYNLLPFISIEHEPHLPALQFQAAEVEQ